MNIARVINISNEFVFKRYKNIYKIPESIKESFSYAVELEDIPGIIISSLLSRYNLNLFASPKDSDHLLFIGTQVSITEFVKKIGELDEHLSANLIPGIVNYFNYSHNDFHIAEREFSMNIPHIMGILNVTPDSFSDGGKYYNWNDAVKHAMDLFDEGADFIDIGGESTRPGSEPVNLNEELNRVIPVIEEILSRKPDAILSIDTTKSRVAYEALKRGVKIVNDISGLSFDPDILNVVKEFNAALVIMHIKGTPNNMQVNPAYDDVVAEVFNFLEEKLKICQDKGVNNLIIDPGIGFGKRIQDNFELLLRLNEFKNFGYPILIGVSKKSFLGKTLNLDINNRETSTAITEAYSISNGARIIRTHNVKNALQAKNLYMYITNPETK